MAGRLTVSCMTACALQVVKRLLKTGALRQLAGILGAMVFVRYGLEPLIKNIRVMMKAQGSWEKSSEYYILREVRRALSLPPALHCGGWRRGPEPQNAGLCRARHRLVGQRVAPCRRGCSGRCVGSTGSIHTLPACNHVRQ